MDETKLNPDVKLDFLDKQNNTELEFRFIYYNNKFHGGTRNEYRLLWVKEFFCKRIIRSPGTLLSFERKSIEGENAFLISLAKKRSNKSCA